MKKYKNLMCVNMIKNGNCKYNNHCMYAHNINEQTLTPIRKLLYEIIDNGKTINTTAWSENNIFKELVILTKKCNNVNCIGGNNCNQGIHDEKYLVCSDNLLCCCDKDCGFYHIRPSKNNKIQDNKIQDNEIQDNKIRDNKIQDNKIQDNKIQDNKNIEQINNIEKNNKIKKYKKKQKKISYEYLNTNNLSDEETNIYRTIFD